MGTAESGSMRGAVGVVVESGDKMRIEGLRRRRGAREYFDDLACPFRQRAECQQVGIAADDVWAGARLPSKLEHTFPDSRALAG